MEHLEQSFPKERLVLLIVLFLGVELVELDGSLVQVIVCKHLEVIHLLENFEQGFILAFQKDYVDFIDFKAYLINWLVFNNGFFDLVRFTRFIHAIVLVGLLQ